VQMPSLPTRNVCVLGIQVSRAKMAEPIEMPFQEADLAATIGDTNFFSKLLWTLNIELNTLCNNCVLLIICFDVENQLLNYKKQEAFEKCWAHSLLRAAARRLFYISIHQVSLLLHAATVARRLHIDVHNINDNA